MKKWKDSTFIAFDLETSGKYPLESQICEIGAVKWRAGKIVDEFQTLIQPDHKIPDEIIKIHNITNEDLVGQPKIWQKIREFHKFVSDGTLVAHHSPFDMGFLTIEFEAVHLKFPTRNVLCSSLLSRKSMPTMENHRLQTLVEALNVSGGQAHRALDDAKACLQVALKCFEVIGAEATVADLITYQELPLVWKDYSMAYLRGHKIYGNIIRAIESKTEIQITYDGGSRPGVARSIQPHGLVRNAKDDYLVAQPLEGGHTKRYYLRKITKCSL